MFSYYKFTNKQIKMLQTLPEEVFVYLSEFLTVTDTFKMFNLNKELNNNEDTYVRLKWDEKKSKMKLYYNILKYVQRQIELEQDFRIRFPLYRRNRRHYRNDETPILNF